MKINSLVVIGLVSFTLIGCGGGGGASSSSSSGSTTSGSASDGYIKGATVTYNGQTTTTGDNGAYSFTFTSAPSANQTIVVSGGIDEATGEKFEGQLSTYVESTSGTVHITPLTTIVASAVQENLDNGLDANLSGVKSSVSGALGVDASMLEADIVEKLSSDDNTTKAQAVTAIQKALTIQKVIEAYSKVADGTTDSAIQSNSANIFKKVAKKLASGNSLDVALGTDTIKEALPTQTTKIDQARGSVEVLKAMVENLDTTSLTNASDINKEFKTQSKAIEVIASKIEKSLLDGNYTEANNTAFATLVMGGVKGIKQKIEETETTVNDSTKELDASTFADTLLTTNVINANKSVYDQVKTYNGGDVNVTALAKKFKDSSDTNKTSLLEAYISEDSGNPTTPGVIAGKVSSAESNVSSIDLNSTVDTIKTESQIQDELKAQDIARNILAVKDNSIKIGSSTKTFKQGELSSSVLADLITTTDSDTASLFNGTLTLTNFTGNVLHNIEDDNSTELTLGVSISRKDTNDTDNLFVIFDKIKVAKMGTTKYSTTGYTKALQTTVLTGATIRGYALTTDGTYKEANVTSPNVGSSALIDTLKFDLSAAQSAFNSDSKDLFDLTDKAKYKVRYFIANSAKKDNSFTGVFNTKFADGIKYIAGDFNSSSTAYADIASVFDRPTFEIKGEVHTGYTTAAKVALDKEALQVGSNNGSSPVTITDNLTLSTGTMSNGSTVTWSSSNTAVISNTGVVTRQGVNTAVTITATITQDGVTVTKTFEFVVQASAQAISYNSSEGWGAKVFSYDGVTDVEAKISLPVGVFHIYVEETTADTSISSVIGTLKDTSGNSLDGNISGVNIKETTSISPAMITITNSVANQTYVIPVSTKIKFNNEKTAKSIWVGVVKDTNNPTYKVGGTLTIGDVTTNSATLLAKGETHNWTFNNPADGNYTLSLESNASLNKLRNFEIKLIEGGVTEKVNTNVSNGSFSQANIELSSANNYKVTVKSTTNTARDALGNYTIKLIKQ